MPLQVDSDVQEMRQPSKIVNMGHGKDRLVMHLVDMRKLLVKVINQMIEKSINRLIDQKVDQ